jgi:outer membrane receptor protein involved in Fe transport
VTTHYEDVHFVGRTDDPRTRQPSFVTVDLQMGIGDPEHGWSFLVTGENLTDERTRFLRMMLENPGDFRDYMNPGRLWYAGLQWTF